MSVGYFNHKDSGCKWYRIEHPMEALNAHGFPTKVLDIETDIEYKGITSMQMYGIYPFRMENVLKFFKDEGIKIIYDSDDAMMLVDDTNPFAAAVKKDAGSMHEVLEYADEITVSTEKMKEYMSQYSDRKITIVPNCYIPGEWTFPRPKRDGIRIGFAGASPHMSDLVDILPAIKNLQTKYPNLVFIIMGFGQEDYTTWFKQMRYVANDETRKILMELDKLLSGIRFEWVPFVAYRAYPDVLINLALDIGICPLKSTPFNDCRSASKAMEYNLAGALAMASDTIPYQSEPTSILVKNTEWEERLEYYITHPEEREYARLRHLEWIVLNRNINTKVDLLKSVYVV